VWANEQFGYQTFDATKVWWHGLAKHQVNRPNMLMYEKQ
jgi:hypothetical protein